jgi:ATP-dependent RNA circularization protein (DNA/RNA ligase family)
VLGKIYKYPSTPHLVVLPGVSVRIDKVLSDREREHFLSHHLIIEEKIDGANLCIYFDKTGNIQLLNRSLHLVEPFSGQWRKLKEWLNQKVNILFDILGEERVLFGEWCYARHSIFYDCLPDWFIAFDIFDKSAERFWSVSKRNELLKQTCISHVPELGSGFFTLISLKKLLSKSRFSKEPAEGLYLRYDENDWLVDQAKLVRSSFIQSIKKHWSRSKIEHNKLAGGRKDECF